MGLFVITQHPSIEFPQGILSSVHLNFQYLFKLTLHFIALLVKVRVIFQTFTIKQLIIFYDMTLVTCVVLSHHIVHQFRIAPFLVTNGSGLLVELVHRAGT